jgi:hypothetical protein
MEYFKFLNGVHVGTIGIAVTAYVLYVWIIDIFDFVRVGVPRIVQVIRYG